MDLAAAAAAGTKETDQPVSRSDHWCAARILEGNKNPNSWADKASQNEWKHNGRSLGGPVPIGRLPMDNNDTVVLPEFR